MVYAPGTLETDPKKQNMALQQQASAISSVMADTATNTANIATNTANIATNTANIATNTADIATNTAAIAAMEAAWTSYTPTISPATGSFTTASAAGKYLQTGKTVLVRIVASITTVGTGAGPVNVTLPFTPNGWVALSGREASVSGKLIGGTSNGSSTIALANYDNTSPIAAGANLVVEGVYEST